MLTTEVDFAVAAGYFGGDGLGTGFPADLPLTSFTAVTLKSTTLQPRLGYSGKVRYGRHGYYLNAIGLRNPGVRAVLDTHLSRWQGRGCPIGISICGQAPDEYTLLAQTAAAAGVDYIELNLSCVNAETPTLTSADLCHIAGRCPRPVYAKIGRQITAAAPTADEIQADAAIASIKQLAGVIIGDTVAIPTYEQVDTPQPPVCRAAACAPSIWPF